RTDRKPHSPRHVDNCIPAHFSIGNESLPSNKGNFSMAQVYQMLEGDFCGVIVIQHNAGGTLDRVMARDGCYRKRQTVMPRCAYDDQPVHRTMVEKLRVLINEIGPEAVAGDKVKIPFLQKMIFNSTQNCDVIPLAHLGHEYADREAASCAKTTG